MLVQYSYQSNVKFGISISLFVSHCVAHSLNPDDVFLPKDIDLDSTEMDETEREVEYFKRYVRQNASSYN